MSPERNEEAKVTAKRRTTEQRGYGSRNQTLRRAAVATGTMRCARCGDLIEARTPWDLGHSDAIGASTPVPSTHGATGPPLATVPRGLCRRMSLAAAGSSNRMVSFGRGRGTYGGEAGGRLVTEPPAVVL